MYCFGSTSTCNSIAVLSSFIIGQCDFENGMCGYVQERSDNFDWNRRRGPTSSTYTGPSIDNTLKNTLGT